MKTIREIIESLIWPDEAVLDTVGEDIRFVSANDAISAMEDFEQERTKDMYPKEFVEWCIESTAKCHPKGQYVEIEGNKEFKTIDELFIYWRDKIK